MQITKCPFCKEEIQPGALICKHCHERLFPNRADLIMNAVMEQIRFAVGVGIAKPSVSACGGLCYSKFSSNKPRLTECLDECKLAEAIAAVAEKLHRELVLTMAEIIWGGGDIDPIPFEKTVRERFKRLVK